MKLRYLLLCFLYIFLAPFVFGQSSIIKINEFLIEPTPQIVELINIGTEIVDLSNWYIDDNSGTTYFTIPAGTNLYPNACISFSGSLNLNRTTADTIRLFDSTAPPTSLSASLIDSFDYKASSGSGVTFQRIPDGQSIWSTGSANFDLYNLTGLSCKIEPTLTLIPTYTPQPSPTASAGEATPTPTPTATPTPEIKAIYLSEVYPYPNESETEWVELFNDNAFTVFLDNWKIDDIADGGSSPKKFSITIPSYSFKVVDLTSSIFNNDRDDVRLLNSSDILVDSFSYDDLEKGKSIGRISFSSTNYCVQNSSKMYSNNSCMYASMDSVSSPQAPILIPSYEPLPSKLNSTVLGTSVYKETASSWEPVRPTQYYERPSMVEEKSLDAGLKNNNSELKSSSDNQAVKVVKTTTLISAMASFLTAGIIFIRIML